MKKVLYAAVLAMEAFVGLFATLLMMSWELWIPCVVTLVVFAALLVMLIKRNKEQKMEGKSTRKTKIWIALVMLIPILPAAYVVVQIALALAIYG